MDGDRYNGRVVVYDPERDLAVLYVPGLHAPAMPLADAGADDRRRRDSGRLPARRAVQRAVGPHPRRAATSPARTSTTPQT